MSQRERQRYHLLWMVLEGRITLKGASERMGVSYRHAKRLKRRFRLEGAKGLVHGNRGRRSPHALDDRLRERIIELSKGRYAKFNDTHFTEKLEEVEGIVVSRETVRTLRRACGIRPKRKRRSKRRHKRR